MVFTWLLIIAETYAFIVMLLGYFQVCWVLDRKPASLPKDKERWPSVDIFIPTYNEPLDVVNVSLIPALDAVGDGFEKGTVFLPQLLQAATAAQAAFEAIKAKIAASGQAQGSKGKIVIATVKGDVHDIGKNIVRVILENYGYDVLDLGRDVDPERVVEAVRQTGAKLVGLSALMTTTVPNMQATIEALHAAHLDCKVMVGGAVLTPDYARDIGADYYCKDAKASADLAKQLLG